MPSWQRCHLIVLPSLTNTSRNVTAMYYNIIMWPNTYFSKCDRFFFPAIRRRLRRPTGNKLLQQDSTVVSDSSASASVVTAAAIVSPATADMETSASVNKFKLRNRVATRKSGTEASLEKHVTAAKDNQDEGGYKVTTYLYLTL